MEHSVGVRRNLLAVSKEERQQYFWCLKMLGIIPPFKSYQGRYFWTAGTSQATKDPKDPKNNLTQDSEPKEGEIPYNQMTPTCLHDELISNHSTCCEHNSFFFAYYHRHLMFHLELRLNYADQILRHEDFKTKYSDLYKLGPERWDRVLKTYKQIAPEKKKVMAHYWNPTNFNNKDDLIIPIELADNVLYPHALDDIDELFKQARGAYPFEINARTRWYNNHDPTFFQAQRNGLIQKFKKQSNFYEPTLQHNLSSYSTLQKQIISGKTNPRTVSQDNFKDFYHAYNTLTAMKDPNGFKPQRSTSNYRSSYRNLQKFNGHPFNPQKPDYVDPNAKPGQTINLLYQTPGEVLCNYGGRFDTKDSMEYIREKDIDRDEIRDADKISYNRMLPHYQYGYALLNQKFKNLKDFLYPLSGSINFQTSHNTMHNNMHFSLNDDNFSLTNLMFFPYHSWIDIQLELKIRMCDNQCQATQIYNHMNNKIKRQERFDPLLNPQNQQQKLGDYPIIEWVDPKFVHKVTMQPGYYQLSFEQKVERCLKEKLSASSVKDAFAAENFYLRDINGKKKLRTSRYLRDFYDNDYYQGQVKVESYKNKHLKAGTFAEFKGFKDYDASYDYEMFETVFDGTTLSNQTGPMGEYPDVKVPKYLLEMKDQVNNYEDHLTKTTKTYVAKHPNIRPAKYYRRLVDKGLLLLVAYKSNIPNATYVLTASLSHLVQTLKTRKYNISNDDIKYLQDRLTILVLPIFGKSNHANQCVNCAQYKYRVVNMNEELFDRYRRLWSWLNKLILQPVIYDNSEPETDPFKEERIDVHKFIEISSCKNLMKLSYIEGAEEVYFDINYVTDTPEINEFSLILTLKTERVQNGESNSSVTKEINEEDLIDEGCHPETKKYSHVYKMQFYNMEDTHSSLDRNDLDGLVYSHVTLTLNVGDDLHQAKFRIKNYHQTIRYAVTISKVGQRVRVKVEDADYEAKHRLYDL